MEAESSRRSPLNRTRSIQISHEPPSTPFASLSPMLSRLSTRQLAIRNDGFDNYPSPLPSDPIQLERILTEHPDVEKQMASDDPDIGPPPDGGLEAWLVVASTVFILFCIHGLVTSFGVFQAYYLSGPLSSYTQSQVSWIASVQLTLTFSGSLISGRYFDAHGPRLLAILGWIFAVGALIGLAFAKEYYQFMLAHACFGLSGSIVYTPATAVVGHWFLKRRGTATGFVSTGVGLGGVIWPIMLNRLFQSWGFRNAILMVAGMSAILMLPSFFFLRARLPPRQPPPLSTLPLPFHETKYLMLVIGSVLVMMSWFDPYFNAPFYATSNRISSTTSSYAVTILQSGSMVGRALCGFLADKFGLWKIFIGSSLACGIIILGLWTPYQMSESGVVVGLLLYGLSSGPWITLVPTACASISPVKELGMRVGMIWSLSGFTLLAGPVICGQLNTINHGRFTYAGLFCGINFILASFITISPKIIASIRNRGPSNTKSPETGNEVSPRASTLVESQVRSEPKDQN